jgi:hypothetical protein
LPPRPGASPSRVQSTRTNDDASQGRPWRDRHPRPCHAWLSGQMARAWGNRRFAAPAPYDEVCLAAGQHDIGWLDWEMKPALDAGTGLPEEFFKVP